MGNILYCFHREPSELEIEKYIDNYYQRYLSDKGPIREPILPNWMT